MNECTFLLSSRTLLPYKLTYFGGGGGGIVAEAPTRACLPCPFLFLSLLCSVRSFSLLLLLRLPCLALPCLLGVINALLPGNNNNTQVQWSSSEWLSHLSFSALLVLLWPAHGEPNPFLSFSFSTWCEWFLWRCCLLLWPLILSCSGGVLLQFRVPHVRLANCEESSYVDMHLSRFWCECLRVFLWFHGV